MSMYVCIFVDGVVCQGEIIAAQCRTTIKGHTKIISTNLLKNTIAYYN